MSEVPLSVKEVKGRITILKIMVYRDVRVYIRRIDGDIFQYDLFFDGQLFSDYLIMKPSEGKKKLTKDEVIKSAGVIIAGAAATVDTLLKGKEAVENTNG